MLTNCALGIVLLLSCGGSTSSTEFDASTSERTDADLLAPDAMNSPHSYACTQVAEAPGDGIFSLRAFEGRLFAGMFGYGQGGSSMLWQYPAWQRTMPGVLGVGESICALVEFQGALYANTENSGDIFRSTDGDNWSLVYNGSAGVIGCGLQVFDNELYAVNFNYAALSDGRILKSSNGLSFSTVWSGNSDGPYLREITSHNGMLYAYGTSTSTSQGFWLSSPDGDNWTQSATPSRFIRGISWRGALYSGATDYTSNGPAGIYRSDGTSTTLVHSESKHYVTELRDWDDALFAATSAGWKDDTGDSGLLMTRNGINWTTVCEFPEVAAWSLEAFDDHLYVGTWEFGGRGKLYRVDIEPET